MIEVTRILDDIQHGDCKTASELLPLVYHELRRLAAAKLAQEKAGQTLQPTALVHEAWLRLTDGRKLEFQSAQHFFATAAEAMRRIPGPGGSRYASQNAPEAHFGLKDATIVDTIRIEWPSGIVQELHNVPAKQILTVTESGEPTPVTLPSFTGITLPGLTSRTGLSSATPCIRS